MTNEEYNKWLFDMQSINLQFNCNDIASSLKAQRDKIKQFCIDCLTGVKHQADSFLFDTNACIFSTSETRELLFSHEEYLILEADTTKVVDGKYPLDYANEIVESNLDTKPKIVFTSSSWWSTPVHSDVFPLTETESYYKQ